MIEAEVNDEVIQLGVGPDPDCNYYETIDGKLVWHCSSFNDSVIKYDHDLQTLNSQKQNKTTFDELSEFYDGREQTISHRSNQIIKCVK